MATGKNVPTDGGSGERLAQIAAVAGTALTILSYTTFTESLVPPVAGIVLILISVLWYAVVKRE